MSENVEQRFGGLESLRIDTHLVVAGQQVLELVLAIRIGRGLVGAGDSTRTSPGQRHLHTGQYLVCGVGGIATVLVDINKQLITNHTSTNGTEVNRVICLSLSQGDRSRSSVRVRSAVVSSLRGGCLVASGRLEGHLVVTGQQVLEHVLTVRIRRDSSDRVTRRIRHSRTVGAGQGHRHARQGGLVGVLETVTVDVHPGVVTNRGGLDETEVHVDDRTGRLSDGHVRGRLVTAGVGLSGLSARQRTGRRINDADRVLAQRQTHEGVLTLGVRHSRDRVAILVEDRGAILLQQRNGNTRVGVFAVIRAERRVRIVVQLASNRVTSGQRHGRSVVRLLITDLILLLDRGRVSHNRTSSRSIDRDSDKQSARRTLLNHLSAQVPLARSSIVSAITLRGLEGHTRRELILRDDAGRGARALVRDGQRVGDGRAGGEATRRNLGRICNRLDDRRVGDAGERPVLVVVRHRTRAQRHLGGQRELLALRGRQVARRGVGLSGALGAHGGKGGLVNGHDVIAGSQVLERVLAVLVRDRGQRLLHARGGRVGQLDGHAGQRLVRTRGLGTTVVVDVPEQGVTNRAISDEAEVDGLIVLAFGERHVALGSVGVLFAIRSRVGLGRGVAGGGSEGDLVVLLARIRDDPLNVRHQVGELVLAVGIRGHGLDGVAVEVDDRVTGAVGQGDGDAGNADLIRILDAVLVRVEPHEVTQRDRLHEREVNLRGVGSASGQLDRRGRHELALTNLGARCRRAVTVGLLVVGQVHVSAVNLHRTRDNLNLVRAQRQTGKGVLTVGIGLRGDIGAGRVLHRVAIRIQQTNRHTLERLITVIEGPPGIGIVIDGARQGATHLEGRAVLVVVRVGVDLIELTQRRRVRDGRTLGCGLDLHEDVQRLGTTNVEVGVENAGLHRGPGTGRRIVVGGRIDRARARVRRTILADTRLGRHVLHTRR